jgi:hypothetical protein
MHPKAVQFRRNAETFGLPADRATNALDKDYWLNVARHWTKMAATEEAASPGQSCDEGCAGRWSLTEAASYPPSRGDQEPSEQPADRVRRQHS